MTTTLSIPGKLQITATTEQRTSRYGSVRPTMTLRLLGDCHYKVALAVAHQVAARIELALAELGLDTLVELGDGVTALYEKRNQIGHQVSVALELVGDTKRMSDAKEQALAERALESVADLINESATR